MSYYYQKGQRAYGPFDREQLIDKLKLGEFGFFDKVSLGNDSWQYVYQCRELESELKALSLDSSKEWVILKNEKEQMGPLSLEQVIDSIRSGAISYSDFIWKEGLTQWVPISQLDDVMNASPKSILAELQGDAELVARPVSTASKCPIRQIRKKEIYPVEVLPEEVDGVDLVPQAWELVD